MGDPNPTTAKRPYFSRVKDARDAISAKALYNHRLYIKAIKLAMKQGKIEAALEALQWLQEHTPAAEDGTTMIDTSIDKQKPSDSYTGPTINVGFALGGLTAKPEMKQLPTSIQEVDGEVVDEP